LTGIKRNALIFLLIVIPLAAAVCGGLAALFAATGSNICPGTYVDSIDIGNIGADAALKKIDGRFDDMVANGHISLKYGENKRFKISYSEIDASVNYGATVKTALKWGANRPIMNFLSGYFGSKKRVIQPVVSYDAGKLKGKLSELAALVNREPVDANIYLKDDKILKVPETVGLKLNIENAFRTINQELNQGLGQSKEISFTDNNSVLETIVPHIVSKDLEGADEIVSRYTTEIKSPENEDSIRVAVSAINKVLIYPLDEETGEEAGVFSFNKYLSQENALQQQNNEGYNQVASTLYAAVLSAGIKPDAIVRTPHRTPVDYIDAGLDAIVFNNSVDFKFKNTTNSILIIFAEVKGNKVIVSLVGKKKDKLMKTSLQVEIEQRYEPPVVNVENTDLSPGEKKLISQGREGLKVNVFIVYSKNNAEIDKKLIHTDKYEAIETLVQTGPRPSFDNRPPK